MDEIDRLLERAATRGGTGSADVVWAGALAVLENDTRPSSPDRLDEPARLLPGSGGMADMPTPGNRPRRAARLLAVAATIALLVAGAAVRWTTLRETRGGTSVTGTVDGRTPTTGPGAARSASTVPATVAPPSRAPSTTVQRPTTTIADDDPTSTALAQAPHYLPGWMPDGYRIWDIAAQRLGDGRYGLNVVAVGPGGLSFDKDYRHLVVSVLPAADDPAPFEPDASVKLDGRGASYHVSDGNNQSVSVFLTDSLRLNVNSVGGPLIKADVLRLADSVRAVDDATFAAAGQAVTDWISTTPVTRAGSVAGVDVELHHAIPEAAGPSAICVRAALIAPVCRSLTGDPIGEAWQGGTAQVLWLPFEVVPGTTTAFGWLRGSHDLQPDHEVPVAADHGTDGTWFRVDVPADTVVDNVGVLVGNPAEGFAGFTVPNWHFRPGSGVAPAATGVDIAPAPADLAPPGTPHVGFFGGSEAMLLAYGVDAWSGHRRAVVDGIGTRLGCGLLYPSMIRLAQYGESPSNTECDWTTRWPNVLDARRFDLAVVHTGAFDLADMTFDGDDQWHHLGDAVADAHFRAKVQSAVDLFTSRGIKVAFVLTPHIDFGRSDQPPPTAPYPVSDPKRADRYNEIVRQVVRGNPMVTLLDLPGQLARLFPGGEMDTTARPDGLHLSKESAIVVADRWLGPELVRLAGGSSWPDVAPAGTPRIGTFGDSTALMTGIGTQIWGLDTGRAAVVGDAMLGCPLVARGEIEYVDLTGTTLERQPVKDECDWATTWPAFLAGHRLDLAVVQFGPFDVVDHRLPGDDAWRHVGDPRYDAAVRSAIRHAAAVFTSRGIHVAWLAAPHVQLGSPRVPPVDLPGSDPARIDRFNALVREVLAADPLVTVLDLPGFLATRPGGEMDATVRPDGVHFTPEAAATIANEWLGPELLKLVPA